MLDGIWAGFAVIVRHPGWAATRAEVEWEAFGRAKKFAKFGTPSSLRERRGRRIYDAYGEHRRPLPLERAFVVKTSSKSAAAGGLRVPPAVGETIFGPLGKRRL